MHDLEEGGDKVAVGGNEGLATVAEVGENVASVAVGDWVIPRGTAFGMYVSSGVFAGVLSKLTIATIRNMEK